VSCGGHSLPESAWWDDYYEPMRARLAQLAPTYADHPIWDAILQDHQTESDMYRCYASYYGHVLLVMATGAIWKRPHRHSLGSIGSLSRASTPNAHS
jgi:hypothetical protein